MEGWWQKHMGGFAGIESEVINMADDCIMVDACALPKKTTT